MPNIVEVTDLTRPELDVFTRLTEAQLRNRLEPEKGIFIAESPKVIARALDAGCVPVSLLMERRHIDGDAADIIARCGGVPVFTAEREVLAKLTGGGAGRHRGLHQRGRHLPLRRRPAHGRGAGDAYLL